ncbi:hypothetical protein Ssi02_77300 [Sinosporangium siamense]|uniref:Uncharacterized protein n=1 Tax=Sinosporangium siamense TaxID=1367973 RepID=A0A919RRP2_9ACTN|nr:hypothetical protein Ssi02_77300 [Sinosporangium siamense]
MVSWGLLSGFPYFYGYRPHLCLYSRQPPRYKPLHTIFDSPAQMKQALDANYYAYQRTLGERMVHVLVHG